jgi:hypothetical protein
MIYGVEIIKNTEGVHHNDTPPLYFFYSKNTKH